MKNFIKKAVAIIEVAAMTLALVAGISFKTVKAADGTLTVNKAIAISIASGSSVRYSFTAPADDTYYFTTEGEGDTYGSLYFDGTTTRDDDSGESVNFAIKQELKKGETCVIEVQRYDNDAFESSLIVYDSATARNIIVSLVPGEEDVYVDLGETATFEVAAYNLTGEKVSLDSEEYSFEWYKEIYSDDSYDEEELEGTSATYTINSITESDYTNQEDGSNIEYVASVYLNEEYYTSFYFGLYTKAEYFKMYNQELYVEEGESLTLKTEVYDYDGNVVDTSGSEYEFAWYKETYNEEDGYNSVKLNTSKSEYTISQVDSTDFYEEESSDKVYYYVELHVNGEYRAYAFFYIYKKEEMSTTEAPTTQDKTTEAPTTKQDTTTVAPTTVGPTTASEKVTAPEKAKIKKVNAKKKAAKKVKISLKKIKGANGYQIAVYKTKKNAKKNKKAIVKRFVRKINVTVKSKKLKNKKALFVKVRAYALDGKTKVYGKWSKVKKVRIKK